MAVPTKLLLLLFVSSLLLHAAVAEIICEEIPTDMCAFAIASSGKRCLLETFATSEVVVERMAGYVETDECIQACGVDRRSVGITSDALLDRRFTSRLCAPQCFQNCPNIVDLYFNLAAGEGVYLPDLCEAQRVNPHRTMIEFLSSGAAPRPRVG
ncbi:hypothetical protein NL676_003079 [Syzygium grande]|nr:hypothetical protein NL676_003079 [Syzygium grande]